MAVEDAKKATKRTKTNFEEK